MLTLQNGDWKFLLVVLCWSLVVIPLYSCNGAAEAARVTIADRSSMHHHHAEGDTKNGWPSSKIFGLEFPGVDSDIEANDDALHIWNKKAFDDHFEQWKDEQLAKAAPEAGLTPAEEKKSRHLQGGTTRYTSNYLSRFKYQLGGYCTGTVPVVRLGCGNGGEVALSRVSDPAMSCAPAEDSGGLICTTACAERHSCNDIFISSVYDDDTYGEIYFNCSGGSKSAAAGFALTGSQNGTCKTSASYFSDNFQFLHLQLGVFCYDAAVDGAYDFSSQFFDCSEDSTAARIPIDRDVEGRYTCIEGESCQFSSCEVDIPSFFVGATEERRDACYFIEDDNSRPFPPSPPPSPSVSPQGDYSIRYQAAWSLTADGDWCDLHLPVLSISCGEAGTITILETSHSEISCFQDSNSLLTCQETCIECDHFISSPFYDFPDRDKLGSVTFSCEGTSFDDIKATVEYPPATYSCSSLISSTLPRRISHNIKLGVFCGSALLGGDFNFFETFSECGLGNDWNIDILDTGDLYCIESEPFFLRADSFEVAVLSAVSITTTFFRDDCYNFVGDPTEAPVLAPTNSLATTQLLPSPAPSSTTTSSPPGDSSAKLTLVPTNFLATPLLPNPAPSSTSSSPPGDSSAEKVTFSYGVICLSLLGLLLLMSSSLLYLN